jgi:hypothetical protein
MTYRSKVATVFLLGFFLDLINMFIASVAFPAMGRTLHASVGELAWVSNGYIAGLTLVLPFSAWLSQQFGTRRVFLLSLSIFSFGALAAGMADSLTSLVMWRALQGMGGGLLIPLGQSLTWQQFRPHERAKLSAAVMLVGLLAPACSPAIGGVLVQSLSWRWVFFASLPIALLTFGLAALWLKDETRRAAGDSCVSRYCAIRCCAFQCWSISACRGLYWHQCRRDVLFTKRDGDVALRHRRPDASVVAGLVCGDRDDRPLFQSSRPPPAYRGRLPSPGCRDRHPGWRQCAYRQQYANRGIYIHGRRRQPVQQYGPEQRVSECGERRYAGRQRAVES